LAAPLGSATWQRHLAAPLGQALALSSKSCEAR